MNKSRLQWNGQQSADSETRIANRLVHCALWACFGCLAVAESASATPVPLQNATATGTQDGFVPANTINGNNTDNSGWAISIPGSGEFGGYTAPQTIVWESQSDVNGSLYGTLFTFSLDQNFGPGFNLQENIGRFRLSVTTSDRSLFADGLANGGNVSGATWTELAPASATALYATLDYITPGDNSILASGTNKANGGEVYTITAYTSLAGITGFRLETLADASLPFNGPGRHPSDGNFVLSEFTVNAAPVVPEPSSALLLLCGGLGILRIARRRNASAIK